MEDCRVDSTKSTSRSAHEIPATVRVAHHGDLDGILAVQRLGGRSTSASFTDAISDAIDDSKRMVVVAEVGSGVVGWATTQYWPDNDGTAPSGHYLMGVTVAPEQRRLGIGHALIGTRIEWIRHRADRVMFFTNARNAASVAAHDPWPFEEICRGNEFRGVRFNGGLGLLFQAQLTRPSTS
jgi:aminoglycoside 6'-N-acetyltransferase I